MNDRHRLVFASLVVVSACSSSTTSTPVSDSTKSTSSPTCGVALWTDSAEANCQDALDKSCCAAEQTCAGDAACKKLVACVDACPTPRQDACIDVCGAGATKEQVAELDAIGDCSKTSAISCSWP